MQLPPPASPTWWDVWGNRASAWSTFAVALFAAAQLWRDWRARRGRERAAKARISAIAYALRRRIRVWLGSDLPSEHALEVWARSPQANLEIELDDGERRLLDIMALLSDAPKDVAKSARAAFVLYVEASRRLTRYVRSHRPDTWELLPWAQLLGDAYKDLADCIWHLERGAIEQAVLETEAKLDEKRAFGDPFREPAEEMLRDDAAENPPQHP